MMRLLHRPRTATTMTTTLLLSAAVLLCCSLSSSSVLVAAAATAAPEITSVATAETDDSRAWRQGSSMGGTRLWIRGINFSEEPGGNAVFIDGVACTVVQFYTTSTVIVADTPPLADLSKLGQELPIAILVDGARRREAEASASSIVYFIIHAHFRFTPVRAVHVLVPALRLHRGERGEHVLFASNRW